MNEGKWGYAYLRRQGKCGWCGREPIEGKSLCAKCVMRQRAKNAAWRAKKKAALGKDTNPEGDRLGRRSNSDLLAAGRCERCHLLKPCVCLPTIQEVATSRVGEGGREPMGANHGGTSKQGAVYR